MQSLNKKQIIVIGAGPAGLMAAEHAISADISVDVYDAMPSVGRKFLLAGKSGMNLTHAEAHENLLSRYSDSSSQLEAALNAFPATVIRDWADSLGIPTFIGSSQRVFPIDMKAAPLLRAWLHRLRESGVKFHMRHKWQGWSEKGHVFHSPEGVKNVNADACIFAFGGASWRRLGSDGAWLTPFQNNQLSITPFEASNCGFELVWTDYFKQNFAGKPLTSVSASIVTESGLTQKRQGQFVISDTGVEGSLIYALSSQIREQIRNTGSCDLLIDLLPGRELERVQRELSSPRGSRSLSSHLRSKLGLHPIHTALVYECLESTQIQDVQQLALALKAMPLRLLRARPIDEAISSAGGLNWSELDEHFMLKKMPGHFCAGEMLNWDAPTGGYLLSACFATGAAGAQGAIKWIKQQG
ncbi:TIGR03862 family flavoprotein [Undibacterium sp. Di24W]|uniref:TIGR03862 family flavoprotein n=1 Tax=Undibacterium sp. Di24W TaxID=3413033 RepID=UPI003BF06DA3